MADEPNWQPAEAPPWLKRAQPAQPSSAGPQWQPADAPPWAKQEKEERGGISEAVRPITTYLPTQKEMAKESLEQIGHGVEQLKEPTGGDLAKSAKAAIKGVGNIGLGAVGYVTSPIGAAYRTVVERPVAETTGSPLAGQAAGFAAQLATPGIGFTRMPGAKPVPSVPTSTLAERRAGKAIERQASDIGKVKEKLETEPTEIVPGSKQSTFEMTDDPGLGAAERKAKLRSPTPFVERAEERAGARLKALEGQQETGNVADTVEHVRQSRARGEWSIQQDVALADQRAREAAELPGGQYDPATYGNVLRQELRNAEAATRAEETARWQQVDPGGRLRANPQPLQELERSIYGVMPEGGAAEASLTAAEQRVAGVIQNYPSVVPFQELRDLRHLINTELREELITSGRSPAYARLSRLRQGIADMEEGAFTEMGVRDPEAAQRLRTASTATRERAEQFGRGPVGDVLRREGSQGPFKVETAQVNDKLLPTGNKGYDVASSYLRAAPDSLEAYTDALTGKMRREVLRPDGSVDPRKLEGFLRRHDGVLRAVSERDGGAYAQSLRDIGQAQERLATTLERQRANTEAFEGSELGKLVGAADNDHAINIVGNIFGRADRVDRARQLAEAASASPAAQAGLRRAVQQYVRKTFVGNAEAAGGTQMIPPNAFMKFMKENEAALRQIMLPEQVDAWKAIATEMGRTSRIAQTKTLPGSDTVQNALSVGGSWPWVVADMVLGQLTTGMPLPLAHAAKPILKGLLSHVKSNGITSTNRLIDEAMLNPEVARELLKARGRPLGASVRMEQRATPLLKTGTLRAATPDDEQQKRAPRQAGGGVPAIGGTGGRPPGARETARAGAARGGTGQALQDGGEAGQQQAAPVGSRERFAAALQGTPTGAGFSGGGQQSKGKALKTPNREDIRRTLQSFGITGEEAGGFAERQLGERPVDSRATGGGVDDEPGGERAPIHYDPGDDTTFGARFGQWDKTATGKSLPRDEEDVDSTILIPGQKMIHQGGYEGERGAAGYYMTRGMDEGGTVQDRWANLPDSRNIEDRRSEAPLSMGQLIAGNQAFMGHYPAPYTRGSRRASTAQARADGGGVDEHLHQGLLPSTLLDETKNYLAEQIAGVDQEHEQQDPLEAAVKHSGAQKNPPGYGGSDEGKLPLPGQSRGLSRPDESLPVMRRNKAGETLPGYIVKSWGEGLGGLMTAPKRAYTGELPPERQVEEFGGPMGMLMTGIARAPAGALGIGRSGRPPRPPKLEAGEVPAADRPVTRSHNMPPDEDVLPPAPVKRATASLSLRDMPLDQAIATAKTERHIIPSNPKVREGYVGAPAWVKTPEDIARLRAEFDAQVERGLTGAKWYQEAQGGIKEMAGPDPKRQHLLAQEKALTSAQSTPDTNLGFALQGHNAIMAGKPLDIVRTGQQADAMREGLRSGEIKLGRKTGIYARHMDPTMENPSTGTNDIWHARALGYENPEGGLGLQEHAFMDAETVLAVARANEKKLGGRSDWTPGEIQAAPWVAGKAEGLQEQFGWSPEKAMAEAVKTYPHHFDKYTAYGTHEATPGVGTRHLPGVAEGTQAERTRFAEDPRSSWRDPSGRDLLYMGLGMWTRPTTRATGVFEGPKGLEINPAEAARPMVGFTGEAGERAMDPASRHLMTAAEAARAYVDAQNAGAWSIPIAGQKIGASGSVYIPRPGGAAGPLPIEDIGKLQAIGGRHGLPGVIDYGTGSAMTSFGGGPAGKDIAKGLRGPLRQEIEGALPGAEPKQVKLDTGYIDYQNLWGKKEGTGAVTRELKKQLMRKDAPEIIARLDRSPELRRAVLGRLQRDAEIAAQTGQPIRADLQRARQIIAESGFSGLFAALKSGAALPAAAFAPLVQLLLQQGEEQPVE